MILPCNCKNVPTFSSRIISLFSACDNLIPSPFNRLSQSFPKTLLPSDTEQISEPESDASFSLFVSVELSMEASAALAEAIKTNKIKKIDKTTNECFLNFIIILQIIIKS